MKEKKSINKRCLSLLCGIQAKRAKRMIDRVEAPVNLLLTQKILRTVQLSTSPINCSPILKNRQVMNSIKKLLLVVSILMIFSVLFHLLLLLQ
jgi:hypothetical protein